MRGKEILTAEKSSCDHINIELNFVKFNSHWWNKAKGVSDRYPQSHTLSCILLSSLKHPWIDPQLSEKAGEKTHIHHHQGMIYTHTHTAGDSFLINCTIVLNRHSVILKQNLESWQCAAAKRMMKAQTHTSCLSQYTHPHTWVHFNFIDPCGKTFLQKQGAKEKENPLTHTDLIV